MPTIKGDEGIWLVVVVVGAMLIAGWMISQSRERSTKKDASSGSGQGGSVIRSWIAVSLVMGLLVFCAAAFLIDDTSARSTLFGGLITSAGAAVAYYFSSKSAEEARADIATKMAEAVAPPKAFSHSTPHAGKVGGRYSYRFGADGHPPITYGVRNGQVPPGLTLDADGTLHGTASSVGSYTFSIAATNALDSIASDDIIVVINPA